jgi:hypothetical protein
MSPSDPLLNSTNHLQKRIAVSEPALAGTGVCCPRHQSYGINRCEGEGCPRHGRLKKPAQNLIMETQPVLGIFGWRAAELSLARSEAVGLRLMPPSRGPPNCGPTK